MSKQPHNPVNELPASRRNRAHSVSYGPTIESGGDDDDNYDDQQQQQQYEDEQQTEAHHNDHTDSSQQQQPQETDSSQQPQQQQRQQQQSSSVTPRAGGAGKGQSKQGAAPSTRARGSKKKRSRGHRIALSNDGKSGGVAAFIHPFHLVCAIFCLCAVGLGIAACLTNQWYVIAEDGNPGIVKFGLWKGCVADDCFALSFGDRFYGVCNVEGAKVKSRTYWLRGFMIASTCAAFVAICLCCAAKVAPQPLSYGLVLVLVLGTLGFGIVIGMFVHYAEHLVYCDREYCDLRSAMGSTASCKNSFGYSLGLVCIAFGALAFGILFAVLRVVFGEWKYADEDAPAQAEQQPPQTRAAAYQSADGTQPQQQPRAIDENAPYAEDEEIPPPPEDGDWTYDEESGMYWSQEEFLYLDPWTQHSYDPERDLWYDPETEEWYKGVDEEEGEEEYDQQ